jgi:cysteinyl-tRNA synthetase
MPGAATAPDSELLASVFGGMALDDDLNTPSALTHLHVIANSINRLPETAERAGLQAGFRRAGMLMGLFQCDPIKWLRGDTDDTGLVEQRIATRAMARNECRFADADRIRDELAAEGILLEDGPGGTTWRRG